MVALAVICSSLAGFAPKAEAVNYTIKNGWTSNIGYCVDRLTTSSHTATCPSGFKKLSVKSAVSAGSFYYGSGYAYCYRVTGQWLPGPRWYGTSTNETLVPERYPTKKKCTKTPAASGAKPMMGLGGGPQARHFDPLNAQTEPMLIRRSYDSRLPKSFAASAAASDVAAKRTSVWSYKPGLDFATNAAKKSAFSKFLDTIPARHNVYVIVHHEPENDFDTLAEMQQWGAMQDAADAIVDAKKRPEIKFGPCLMGPWTFDVRSPYFRWHDRWADLMDWDFDFVGIDAYRTVDDDKYTMERMLTMRNSGAGGSGKHLSMIETLRELGGPDIDFLMAEFGMFRKQPSGQGANDPPTNPFPEQRVVTWMNGSYDYFKRWNAGHPRNRWIAALWFNYSLVGSDNPIDRPLHGSPTYTKKIAAWKKIVADSKK